MIFDIEKSTNKLLFLLILADLCFIFIHVLFLLELLRNPLFSIEQDFGYGEVYQYIKEYWIMVMLFIIAVKRTTIVYFTWSLLFMYLLLDDALKIHENFGITLANYWKLQPNFGLRAQDYGELSITGISFLILFLLIGIAYLFSDKKARKISRHLLILVLSVAFFGVLVDMLHIVVPWNKPIFGLIEDGGEMLVMSIIVWYVFALDFSKNLVGVHG